MTGSVGPKSQTPTPRLGHSIYDRLKISVILFIATMATGTFVYAYLLELNLLEAFYFTVVTLSTVGYGDIMPQTQGDKLFTAVFIICGIATASLSFTLLIGVIIEGELQNAFGKRTMRKTIERMKNHIIVCGYGRIGAEIARAFQCDGEPFVIIDDSEEACKQAAAEGCLILQGDATQDEILELAGISQARCIVPALATDVDNLFIIITARQLNPKINIIARALEDSSAQKMKKAGADKIIRPLHIGANHLAQAVLRPTALDFIEVSSMGKTAEYRVEEIPVGENSGLSDRTLIETDMRRVVGVVLIGIKRRGGKLIFNPSGETKIHAGDTMVAMGDSNHLDQLKELASTSQTP